MARKNRDEVASWDVVEPEPVICPMCERVIPDDQQDAHHLVPKSKGGKKTVCLHRVCHDQIHALFTDSQLAKKFFTIEALLEDPAVQKFVAWIKSKPPGFFRLGQGIAANLRFEPGAQVANARNARFKVAAAVGLG